MHLIIVGSNGFGYPFIFSGYQLTRKPEKFLTYGSISSALSWDGLDAHLTILSFGNFNIACNIRKIKVQNRIENLRFLF